MFNTICSARLYKIYLKEVHGIDISDEWLAAKKQHFEYQFNECGEMTPHNLSQAKEAGKLELVRTGISLENDIFLFEVNIVMSDYNLSLFQKTTKRAGSRTRKPFTQSQKRNSKFTKNTCYFGKPKTP